MKRTPLKWTYQKTEWDRGGAEAWKDTARRRVCANCGSGAFVEGHHIIEQQELKRKARDLYGRDEWRKGFERLRWDRRNLLPLCRWCHVRHHSAQDRLSLARVRVSAPGVDVFARELGLEWWLEREYR